MSPIVSLHILGGGLGLITGFIALYAVKGSGLHRRSGLLFVLAMLAMTVSAMIAMALHRNAPAGNMLAAMLTSYLVITALTTVLPPAAGSRRLDVGLMATAFAVGLAGMTYGFEALASPGGGKDGIPAFPYFLFGVAGLLGSALDLRMIRSGGLRGAPRIARHLWRMCFALFIAAMSFFLGQADEIPEMLRIPALLALPPLAVFLTMLYWLRRVRVRQGFPSVARRSAPLAVPVSPSAN